MSRDEAAYRAILERASVTLAVDASPMTRSIIEEKLEKLAAELLLEWIVGDKRFESQSQQSEYWLSRFYEELFIDEQPDATRIYERFNLSLPRAAHLARLLRARRTTQWRHAARLELRTQLARHKDKAAEARAAGQGHIQEFDLSLSPGAADELRVIYDRIATFVPDKERPSPPKGKPSFGSSRWWGIPADTLLSILNNLPIEATQ